MAIRFYKFIIVLGMMFLAQKGFAQRASDSLPSTHVILPLTATTFAPSIPDERSPITGESLTVPSDHYVKNLAFFCRQELKFEKAVKIPLRIRVGSLAQCNALEGK